MIILALDTSGKVASSAICKDGEIIAFCERDSQMDHSRTILPVCEQMLAGQGLKLSDMDVFAAACGPGSFTGIRIGVSAVKGFAWALGKLCAGVSTLEAAAYSLEDVQGVVCAVIRAREREYYYAVFDCADGGNTDRRQAGMRPVARLCDDGVAPVEEILQRLQALQGQTAASCATVTLCGDGAEDFYRDSEQAMQESEAADSAVQTGIMLNLRLPARILQNAAGAARCAYQMAQQGRLQSCHEIKPSYLRQTQAERMRLQKESMEK